MSTKKYKTILIAIILIELIGAVLVLPFGPKHLVEASSGNSNISLNLQTQKTTPVFTWGLLILAVITFITYLLLNHKQKKR